MPCAYHRNPSVPEAVHRDGCQFHVRESGLIDFAGRRWCPFHLPLVERDLESGKAAWDTESTDALLNAVHAYVNMAKTTTRRADLSGVVFPADVTMDMQTDADVVLPALVFSGARFAQEADFIEAQFTGPVSFAGAAFDGDADFIVADFADHADFSGAHFKAGFDASEARFHGAVSFRGAIFDGPAIFRETQFSHCPDFTGATFQTPPTFEHVNVPDGCSVVG